MIINWKKSLVVAGLLAAAAVPFAALADGFNFRVKVGDDNEKHYHFRDRKVQHDPQMLMAAQSMAEAKNHLWNANNDYNGHRTRAIQHINMALDEMRVAEESGWSDRRDRNNRDNRNDGNDHDNRR